MTRRTRTLAFGSAALLVGVGVAAAIVFSSTVGQVLAIVLIGVGLVLAVSLVFLEVGLSEDRELARERARRAKAERVQERRWRPRLPRLRGGPRRLR